MQLERVKEKVQTHALGHELRSQRPPRSVHDLAQCLHIKRFSEADGNQLSEGQIAAAIEAIEDHQTLPFDITLLASFNELAAKCLSNGDTQTEGAILDRLALAATHDILRDMGISLPDI